MNIEGLEIVVENASYLAEHDNAAFALARKMGLGASDASVFLGLMSKWKTRQDLIAEKLRMQPTQEELEINQKEAVRKGKDLEPLILQKFVDVTGLEVIKPEAMYRIIDHPFLTVNFDGITEIDGQKIPVECKFVSMYGNKYWNLQQACTNWQEDTNQPWMMGASEGIFEDMHTAYGPPAYYIAQIQQQMLALNAPYGFFSVIFDKGWEHAIFKVYSNQQAKNRLILEGYSCWNEIQRLR